MSRVSIYYQIISFFIYLLYQVLILQNVVLFHTAFCFLYVAYLLVLPVETNPLALNGYWICYGICRRYVLRQHWTARICLCAHHVSCEIIGSIICTPQGGYDSNDTPSLALNGLQWFMVYATPLVFLHHAVLFFAEVGGFGMFWFTLWKIITSTLFTLVVILIAQFLFPGRRSDNPRGFVHGLIF